MSAKPVTGLAVGERLVDIDWRHHPIGEPPPPPQLFGLGLIDGPGEATGEDTVRLYTIDIATATATPVGAGINPVDGDRYGIDFNPTSDFIRVVSDGGKNLRLDPNTGGLVAEDTDLNPEENGKVTSIAYDRVEIPSPPIVPSNTTAFAISIAGESLVTIGGVNASPSPNGGTIMNPKPLGLALAIGSVPGFDISPSAVAFATLEDAATGLPGVYTINLGTGAATLVGTLPQPLSSIAIVPQSALPVTKDVLAPTVQLKGVKRKMSFAAFLKGVVAKVTPSEPASLKGELLGAAKKAQSKKSRLASFSRVLAKKSLPLAAGRRTLKLKPKKRLLGRPEKAFKVRLRITATDAAGNAGALTRTIKVKPPKPVRTKASRAAASPARR